MEGGSSTRGGTNPGSSVLTSTTAEGGRLSLTASLRQSVRWVNVKESIVNGTLIAVGLKPTKDEERHREAMKLILLSKQGDNTVMLASHDPRDASIIRNVSQRDFGLILPPREETDGGGPPPPPSFLNSRISVPSSLTNRQMSIIKSYKAEKGTGRNQAKPAELKPDLWKLAYTSIRTAAKKEALPALPVIQEQKKSFVFEGGEEKEEEEEEEEEEGGGGDTMEGVFTDFGGASKSLKMELEEEDFFGPDYTDDTEDGDETDSAPFPAPYSVEFGGVGKAGRSRVQADSELPEKPEGTRRTRIKDYKKFLDKVTFKGGYLSGYGNLGALSRLLHFRYEDIEPASVQKELDNQLFHKRPYFTYWLMVVHLIIMIVTLSVYGFAPYGWDLIQQREIVRQTDLSFATISKLAVPSVWGGPPQQALVVLGALFAPCMRRDRQLLAGIESDRRMENDSSGCCVRRDRSGCFQADQAMDCQSRFSDFFFIDNDTRAVCGTSPKTCLDPAPGFLPGAWVPSDISTWPICRSDLNENASAPHLLCEVTSRPCCYGIQAICTITTREQCQFLDGLFHQDAFLCSQVDCLNEICGLLPFAKFDQPDQIYRLYLALFLHAGIIHLILSLLFSFFILRYVEKRLGWLRTSVIYIGSGIGGNLVSAYFAPYNPEVGPAGSILGIVAYVFVFLIFESRILVYPGIEFLKMTGVCVFLFVLGLIPYIDNYAHIGGFVFGFLISGIIIPYAQFEEMYRLTKKINDNKYLIIKRVMIGCGIPAVIALYTLFFLLFYLVQTTWQGFSFLTCIPFTSTLCVDQQVLIRDRETFIV